MVHASLAFRAVSASLIEARAHALLDLLDDVFVLPLHPVYGSAGSLIQLRRIPDVGQERDPGTIRSKRHNNINAETPRIKIEHRIGEKPEVISPDLLAMVRGRRRQLDG